MLHTSVSDNMSAAFGLALLADGDALLADPALPCCSALSLLDRRAADCVVLVGDRPLYGLVLNINKQIAIKNM